VGGGGGAGPDVRCGYPSAERLSVGRSPPRDGAPFACSTSRDGVPFGDGGGCRGDDPCLFGAQMSGGGGSIPVCLSPSPRRSTPREPG